MAAIVYANMFVNMTCENLEMDEDSGKKYCRFLQRDI